MRQSWLFSIGHKLLHPFNRLLSIPAYIRYALALLLTAFYFCLPSPLFDVPYSTVVTDRDNHLLGAHIADDGQWRFPVADSVPKRYIQCLLAFEDESFYVHPGVNPLAMLRAAYQNIRSGKIISGGSTITMQTIRLARPAKRNLWNKVIEMVRAIRLELHLSKSEILTLYAAHAPYGANVVGLEAASWRYFACPASELSWAESATLAVLPNAPGLVHPGRNRNTLKTKRDRLLNRLLEKKVIDTLDYQLSIDEPIVEHPATLPRLAPHVLASTLKKTPGTIFQSSLTEKTQQQAIAVVERHARTLRLNQVHNAAAIIIDNQTAKVLAYVGNTLPDKNNADHGNQVDVIQSSRSSGSILKPLLYAASLNDGLIWPRQLIKDVPTYYSDFSPQNYNRSYDGAVRADEALARSLNIPFVLMQDNFGTERFLQFLQKTGFTSFPKPANHYGLSLILGGGETKLCELAGVYSSIARIVQGYVPRQSRYDAADLSMPLLNKHDTLTIGKNLSTVPTWLTAGALWFTLDAMTRLNRPEEESGWEAFASSQKIAWKTGTSFGFRDAWAIGVTPEYTVAVWVGNADGEGRPGITGGSAAAPIMFDLFRLLPSTSWFQTPLDDLNEVAVCRHSGMPAGPNCEVADTMLVPHCETRPKPCPYHHLVHLDQSGRYRVTSDCYSPSHMLTRKWFVLPPLTEWYFRHKSPLYNTLPPMLNGCIDETLSPMEFIYPTQNVAVYIPKNIQGDNEQVVVKIAHRNPTSKVYWYANNIYLGETSQYHQMGMQLTTGTHTITCTDEAGNRIMRRIKCLNKE